MSHAHGFLSRFSKSGAPALLPAIVAMVAILAGCLGERVAGTTSTGNTGKGTISGRVLNAKGEGVANARVRVVSVDHNPGPGGSGPGEVADVALTAADGTFRTDSLADGLYNLLDEKSGELSFRDSVAVDADTAAVAEDDVLRPPGSLAGVVRLQPGHDSRTVFLILLGTTTLSFPMDSVGNFRLANLAEGEYRLRILSTLDAYQPLDTVVTIVSGIQGILPDTLRLAYKATSGVIPIVESLQVAYDTARISATLTWRKADPAMVASYRVYRRHGDSAYVKLNKADFTDTQFVDDWATGLRPGERYGYSVTVVDPRGDEGRKTEVVPLIPGVRYKVDFRIPGGTCNWKRCGYDVDAAGDAYISEWDGFVARYGVQGGKTAWKDPHLTAVDPGPIDSESRPLAVDSLGGSVYMLYKQPMRLGKVDSLGRSVWIKPMPLRDIPLGDRDFSLHRVGDTLLIWEPVAHQMTYLDLNGGVLGQDTLLRLSPISSFPRYKPGAGFFQLTESGIRLLDRDGSVLVDWRMEFRRGPEDYPADLERDSAGRWYLLLGSGVVQVFSPDRTLLGTVLTGKYGATLRHKYGRLFMSILYDNGGLVEIVPGF